MGKDIHVESMDAEATAAIRKDSKMVRKEWKQNMYAAQNHGSWPWGVVKRSPQRNLNSKLRAGKLLG